MLIVAKFRVAAKRAAQMEDLLRGLAAHIALEADPEIHSEEEVIPVEAAAVAQPEEVATESQDSAADAPQEVNGEQELLRSGDEAGDRQGQEPGEADERDGAERADAGEDGLVAGAPGEGAAA